MNFEDNNVIQVESDSDDLVVATKLAREQSQVSTLGATHQFLKVCAQLVGLMAVLISFSTTLIGNLFRLVNNSKLSIMTRACALVAVAFVWSVFFAINSVGFAQSTPGITIFATGTGMQSDTIKEGEEISVTIQRTASASTPLDVTIEIEEITSDTSPANILEDSLESSATTATIPANATNLTYAISSQQDTSSTNGGAVVITLIASTADPITYSIPSQDSEKKVTFTVSHYEPTISIHPAGTTDQIKTIMEGEAMSVDVKRSDVSAFPLDVTIMIAETPRSGTPPPNILENSLEGSIVVTIPASKLSFTYTIDSQQDSANGAGEAVFTLVNATTYALPTAAANQKVTFTVTHFAGPIATIELANTDVVSAGTAAEFVVRISKTQSSNFTVVITISGDTDYISGSAGDRNVIIPAGMLSKTQSEATTDTMNNTFGTLNATIKANSNYVLGATKRSATVYVNDSNVPRMYISPLHNGVATSAGRIISGQTGQFNFRAINVTLVRKDIRLRYSIQEKSPPGINVYDDLLEGNKIAEFEAYHQTTNSTPETIINLDTLVHTNNLNGLIIATLNIGPGYELFLQGFNPNITFAVFRKPRISIIPINNSVLSSERKLFEISTDFIPPLIERSGFGFDIKLENYVNGALNSSPTFTMNNNSFTHVHEVNASNSPLEIRIKSDESYNISSQNDRATVTIRGSTLPKISISTPDLTLIETDGSINFILSPSSTPARTAQLAINVDISESADFIAASNEKIHSVILPPNDSSVTLTIPIESDQINEAAGSVNAVVLGSENYTVPIPTDTNKRRVSVLISDDDQPTISIIPVARHVVEGAPARFKVIATPTPQTSFLFTYELTQTEVNTVSSSVIDRLTETIGEDIPILFPANQNELEISVNSEQDSIDEAIASMFAEIKQSNNYKLSAMKKAEVRVIDDDGSRIAVISPPPTPVSEGDTAEFFVSVAPAPTSDLTVRVEFEQGSGEGILMTSPDEDSVVLTSSNFSGTVSIATKKDGIYGKGGTLTALLVASTLPSISILGTNPASIAVADADAIPTIAIAPRTGSFNETSGNSITFNLTTTTSAPITNTTILVEVDDGENNYFTQDSPFELTSTLNANASATTLVITPENDFEHDPDGTFTVTVISPKAGTSMNYIPAAAPLSAATITYTDDDFDNLPILSISAPPEDVMEADEAEAVFTIASEETLPQGLTSLTIQTIITDSGDYISDSEGITSGMQIERQISFTGSQAELRIAIDNDANMEDFGKITVQLVAEDPIVSYKVKDGGDTANVIIADDDGGEDVFTRVKISVGDGPHNEGESIELTVTGTGPLTNPVTITVMVSETEGDNILTSSPLTMRVELSVAPDNEKKVSFQTVKNGIHMLGGNLTASMTTTNTDVAVGTPISVTVVDVDDTPPIVSISTQATSVLEGGMDDVEGVEITLTANNSVSNRELPITLEIDDGDHNFFANANPNPVVVNLPARERLVTHTITPENDEVKEAPGKFTVIIQAPADNTNFTVADAPRNMVSIQFVDDDNMDLPEVSVTPVLANITEGTDDNAAFKLIVTPTPTTTTSLSIRYLITVSGDYIQDQANNIGEKTEMITFQNGEFTVPLLIDDDSDSEPRGTITFKLLYETADLTYLIDTDNSTAEVVVTDDEGGIFPQINISAEDSVVEGEDIIFTLTATTMDGSLLTTELVFNLILTQTGSFLADNAGTRPITITEGIAMQVESTILLANRVSGGMITAEVEHDSASPPTYSRGEEFRKVVDVELYANPIVSIDARTTSITAGATAVLTISTPNPSESSDLNVLVNINQSHEFIRWRIPSVFGIPMGQESIDIKIPTRKKMLSEDTEGSITVTIRVSSDYQFRGDPEEVIIMVNGSEEDPPGARLSVADAVVNAILNLNQDDPEIPETVEQSPIAENVQPIVSIQANEHVVAEGQPVQFSIRTQITSVSNLVVNINISGGQSFVNISSPNQQVQIFNGQSSTIYALDTINDDRAEGDETVIVTIVEGEGYSIASPPSNQATTLVSDANDRAKYNQRLSTANSILIPELMATTGVQSYQTMSNRVHMAFTNEEQFLFEVGGQSNPTEILKLGGKSINEQVDLMELLRDDTEIAINLSSDNAVLNNTTAWLKSENQNIYNLNHTDSTAWSGDFYTGNFGIDVQLGSGLLLGIASSISENDISLATEQTQEFLYTARYNGFNPYIAVNSPALNTQLWVSSNISSGYIDVDSENQQTHRFDSQYSTMTFGGESRLLSSDNSILDGLSELNLTSQGWIAQQSIFGDGHFTSDLTTSGHNIQVALTGSHEFDITEIGTLKPNVLVGIQTAKNDTEKVSGLEIGFGTTYSNFHGLTLEGSGRGFKGSEQQDYATTFTGSLNYNPNSENIGSQLKISPSWGYSATATQLSLWQSNLTNESNLFNHFSNGLQVKTEFSYGINILDGIGILTPFSAIDYSGSNFITYNIGNQFEIGNNSSFEVIGTHEIRNTNIINNKLQLQGIVRW